MRPPPSSVSPRLLRLPALEELSPPARGDLDVELARRGADPAPGPVTVGVAHALDLVEPRDRVPHVLGVDERLLALLGEREGAVGQVVLLRGAQPARPAGHRRAATPRGLGAPRLLEVLAGGLLLLGRRHGWLLSPARQPDRPSVPAADAASRRSLTSCSYNSSRARSSARRIADGCSVTTASTPSAP